MHFPRPSLHQLERKAPELLGLVALALTLYLAAAAVTAWIAGFHTLDHHLVHPTWSWLPLSLGRGGSRRSPVDGSPAFSHAEP